MGWIDEDPGVIALHSEVLSSRWDYDCDSCKPVSLWSGSESHKYRELLDGNHLCLKMCLIPWPFCCCCAVVHRGRGGVKE